MALRLWLTVLASLVLLQQAYANDMLLLGAGGAAAVAPIMSLGTGWVGLISQPATQGTAPAAAAGLSGGR